MWVKGQKNTEKGSNFEQNSIKWRFTVVVQANRVVDIAHSIVLEYVLGTKGHNSQITWWHGTINRHNFQKKVFWPQFWALNSKSQVSKDPRHIFSVHDDGIENKNIWNFQKQRSVMGKLVVLQFLVQQCAS